MSEMNIIETIVYPELPDAIGVQSIYLTVPIASYSYPGIVRPSASDFVLYSTGGLVINPSYVSAIKDVSSLSTRLGSAEGDISSLYTTTSLLSSRVGVNENDILALSGAVSINTSAIASISASVNDILNTYAMSSLAAKSIQISIDNSTYVMTTKLLNGAGNVLSTSSIDLPLENVVVSGSYSNGSIILTLQNGNTIPIPVGDLINGLQTEITSSNKLPADLVTDAGQTHKFVTEGLISQVGSNTTARHTHANKALLDTYTVTNINIENTVSKAHTHDNKSLLDTYNVTNANIESAVAQMHSHSNKTVLDALSQTDIENLSQLASIISSGGLGGNGTYNYNELMNLVIYPDYNDVLWFQNNYKKLDDTLSITGTLPSVGDNMTNIYYNVFKNISSYPTQYITPSVWSGKSITNNVGLGMAIIDGGYLDENYLVPNLSGISYSFLGSDGGNDMYFAPLFEVTGYNESYPYGYYLALMTSTSESIYTQIVLGIASQKMSNPYDTNEFNKILDTYNAYDEFRAVSDGSLISKTWYTAAGLVPAGSNPMYTRLSCPGSITGIYEGAFLYNNFINNLKYFPGGDIVKQVDDVTGTWSPVATSFDINNAMSSRVGIITEAPISNNSANTLSIVYLSSTPSSMYSGYMYIINN